MNTGWRVLDFTTSAVEISAARGQLAVASSKGIDHVPVADIAVLLLGLRTTINAGAMHHLAANDVVTMACDWRGVPYGGMYAWSDHTRVGARQLAQSTLTKPRQKNAWMQLIRAKVRGQATTLSLVDDLAAARLDELATQVRSGDPSNVEAVAARWYWNHLFAEQDFLRDYEAQSGTNTLLNYGYGVLRGIGIRATLAAGLTPAIGVFHRHRGNPFNLVEDLIEPFRPAVDASVLRLGTATLDESHTRETLVASCFQAFDEAGGSVSGELTALAQRLGAYVEGDQPKLTVKHWTDPRQGDHGAAW